MSMKVSNVSLQVDLKVFKEFFVVVGRNGFADFSLHLP